MAIYCDFGQKGDVLSLKTPSNVISRGKVQIPLVIHRSWVV